MKALRDPKDLLQGLVTEPEWFLDFPLVLEKTFGPTELITRADGFYCWVVSSEDRIKLTGVKGVDNAREWTEYELAEYSGGEPPSNARQGLQEVINGKLPKLG